MATNTTNYNLVKPDATDFYDINVHNENMDVIDEELNKKSNKQNYTYLQGSKTPSVLTTVGWYRFLETDILIGAGTLIANIRHYYNNAYPHDVTAVISFDSFNPRITVLAYAGNGITPTFTKIRIVKDTNNKMYVDVYYNINAQNNVYCNCLNSNSGAIINSIEFTSVAETVTGETVVLAQDIKPTKNGTIITTGNSASDIGAFGMLTDSTDTDLNTFITIGSKRVVNATNKPTGTGGYGLVWNIANSNGWYLIQYYLDANTRNIYRRCRIDNVWTSWLSEAPATVVTATVE